jgi:hypothetical protein
MRQNPIGPPAPLWGDVPDEEFETGPAYGLWGQDNLDQQEAQGSFQRVVRRRPRYRAQPQARAYPQPYVAAQPAPRPAQPPTVDGLTFNPYTQQYYRVTAPKERSTEYYGLLRDYDRARSLLRQRLTALNVRYDPGKGVYLRPDGTNAGQPTQEVTDLVTRAQRARISIKEYKQTHPNEFVQTNNRTRAATRASARRRYYQRRSNRTGEPLPRGLLNQNQVIQAPQIGTIPAAQAAPVQVNRSFAQAAQGPQIAAPSVPSSGLDLSSLKASISQAVAEGFKQAIIALHQPNLAGNAGKAQHRGSDKPKPDASPPDADMS